MSMNKKKEFGKKKSRERLDIGKIVHAAIALLDESGLEQLSTRRLADALGIRSASLYWHVSDKAELLQWIADHICGRLELPNPNLAWQDQVLAFARNYRTVLLSVRDGAEILLATPPFTPNRLALMESMFNSLVKAGFPRQEIVMASMLVNDYVLSFVKNESRMTPDRIQPSLLAAEDDDAQTGPYDPRSLERYPTLSSLLPYMLRVHTDEHFEYGLNVLLGSLERRVNPSGLPPDKWVDES